MSTPVKEVGIVLKNLRTQASLISSEEVPLLVGFYTDEDQLTNATGPYVVLAGTLLVRFPDPLVFLKSGRDPV